MYVQILYELVIIFVSHAELSVGFEELSYTVSESAGTVEVCVVVISPPPTDDLCVTVTLSPSTIDGTAGIINFKLSIIIIIMI